MTGTEEAPGSHAGLMIVGKKRDTEWFALVSYFLESDGVLVQPWLPSALLRPADR